MGKGIDPPKKGKKPVHSLLGSPFAGWEDDVGCRHSSMLGTDPRNRRLFVVGCIGFVHRRILGHPLARQSCTASLQEGALPQSACRVHLTMKRVVETTRALTGACDAHLIEKLCALLLRVVFPHPNFKTNKTFCEIRQNRTAGAPHKLPEYKSFLAAPF